MKKEEKAVNTENVVSKKESEKKEVSKPVTKKTSKVTNKKTKNKLEESKKEKKVSNKDSKDVNNSYVMPIVLLMIIALTILLLPNISKINDWFREIKNNKEVPNITTTTKKVTTTSKKIDKGDKSGAAGPVLTKDLVPIRYNQVTNKWVKADINNPSDDYWYNYETAEWANAVFVKENGKKTRNYYLNSKPGTVINEEDIIGYFVWVPRFSYYVDNVTKKVEIKFEKSNDDKSIGDGKTNYLTHPSFTANSKELSGLWVGKYELSGTVNEPTILDTDHLAFKSIGAVINSLENIDELYNLYNTKLNLIKNSEWGAILYLTYSKYGICLDEVCKITDLDSSTNNNTGIYGLNIFSEYVMGNFGQNSSYSGVNTEWFNNNDLYDLYIENSIVGDGTSDLKLFYNQNEITLNAYNPWIVRGDGSMFAYAAGNGSANYYIGYRVVLH